jgi:hypothetical protein
MQDWVVDYDKEGQERAVRKGRDNRVGMMAVVAEDGNGGRRWQMTTATVDDDSGGGQRQWRKTMARKIGWRTTRGKEEIGR